MFRQGPDFHFEISGVIRDKRGGDSESQLYIENFTTKNWKFSDENSDIFHISAQNIDCRYSLEPPRQGSSN